MTENTLTLIVMHLVLGAVALNRLWPNPLPDDDYKYRIAWSVIAVLVPAVGPLLALAFYEMPAPEEEDESSDDDEEEDSESRRRNNIAAAALAEVAQREQHDAKRAKSSPVGKPR